MALKTGNQYLESIKSLDLQAHMMGKETNDLPEHGLVEPSQKAVAFTFDAAHDPQRQDLFCVESSLCSDTVNRFTHLHQSTEDLVNKVKMQRYCGVQTGCEWRSKNVTDFMAVEKRDTLMECPSVFEDFYRRHGEGVQGNGLVDQDTSGITS